MGTEADPKQESDAAERERAEHAAQGEAKGGPDSGRHGAETAIHRQDGPKSEPTKT